MKLTSLTVKIALVVLIVSLLSVGLVAFFSGWTTVREYDRLLIEQVQGNFVDQATAYYAAKGTWEGAIISFGQMPEGGRGGRRGPFGRQNDEALTPLVLLDANGCVIGPTDTNYTAGDCLPTWQVNAGAAVTVDNARVGTVIATGVLPARDPSEEAFIQRTGRGLLLGAIAAAVLAVLLGAGLATTLTRPLRRLTDAIHATAEGDLGRQVDIRSRDEIGELAGAFNRMSTELAQSNQARKQMTADVAHELRNPLMVMTGYIEALRDGVLRPTPARFDMMYEEAQHLQRLVADLRTLSLADAGELALTRQISDPRTLLERVADAYVPVADKKAVSLAVAPGVTNTPVNVDVERIVQVLANLVTNAIRHTPAGGTIRLNATASPPGSPPDSPPGSPAGSASQVVLTVQDSGEGIAPDALPRIFDRFYRGDQARVQDGDESGLGLAICKSIITAHGGTIAATSTPGQGATFSITLPAAA